jgi:hypothetical protein
VCELLTEDGSEWNEDKLQEVFYEQDVLDIRSISVGGAGTEDYHVWNFTKNGIFLVRSAYHLAMKQKKVKAGMVESSSSCSVHKGWLALWSTNVPGKVKIHTWRLLKNGLAVGSELARRRIKAGVDCVACGREETALHRFWHCPHAQLRSRQGDAVYWRPAE